MVFKIVYSKKYWFLFISKLIEDILDERILIWEKFEAGVNAATQKGQKADVTKGSPTSIFRVT